LTFVGALETKFGASHEPVPGPRDEDLKGELLPALPMIRKSPCLMEIRHPSDNRLAAERSDEVLRDRYVSKGATRSSNRGSLSLQFAGTVC